MLIHLAICQNQYFAFYFHKTKIQIYSHIFFLQTRIILFVTFCFFNVPSFCIPELEQQGYHAAIPLVQVGRKRLQPFRQTATLPPNSHPFFSILLAQFSSHSYCETARPKLSNYGTSCCDELFARKLASNLHKNSYINTALRLSHIFFSRKCLLA